MAYLVSIVVVAAATLVGLAMRGQQRPVDVVMVYLLGVVVVSMRYGRIPSLVVAVLSVLSFDFFFIAPYYTFAVNDVGHVLTFGVMFLVALVINTLTQRLRDQAEHTRNAQLQIESEQLRNALLSSISHDLRTPLAVVTGAATTLLDEKVSSEVRRELTETIVNEAERLNRRVQNLLDMTRVQAGALPLRKQWQPLEEVVGSALRAGDSLIRDREVRVAIDRAPLVPLDAALIEQVILNLLENAARYAPPRTPIDIEVVSRTDEVEVTVADRGHGVAEADRARIFEKFQRARDEKGGTGLGLAICAGIVGAHGGRIWVDDREGGGAAFRFTLPIVGTPPILEQEP